jgi:hypothetical protein
MVESITEGKKGEGRILLSNITKYNNNITINKNYVDL